MGTNKSVKVALSEGKPKMRFSRNLISGSSFAGLFSCRRVTELALLDDDALPRSKLAGHDPEAPSWTANRPEGWDTIFVTS
jgi:hypothetical protein